MRLCHLSREPSHTWHQGQERVLLCVVASAATRPSPVLIVRRVVALPVLLGLRLVRLSRPDDSGKGDVTSAPRAEANTKNGLTARRSRDVRIEGVHKHFVRNTALALLQDRGDVDDDLLPKLTGAVLDLRLVVHSGILNSSFGSTSLPGALVKKHCVLTAQYLPFSSSREEQILLYLQT